MTGTFVCETCTYPSRAAAHCDNPGCVANPSVSEKQKALWAEEAERSRRYAVETAERIRLRRKAYACRTV